MDRVLWCYKCSIIAHYKYVSGVKRSTRCVFQICNVETRAGADCAGWVAPN